MKININDNIVIFIVNFNTTQLTNQAIASIRNFSNIPIVVFDNSNVSKFINNNNKNIIEIDNTQSNIINFEEDLLRLDKKFKIPLHIKQLHQNGSNYGSYKHSKSIQWAFDNINIDNLILFDSDIVVKNTFDNIINSRYATVGQIFKTIKHGSRIYPFIQYINLKLIHQHNINFYDENRMQDISKFYIGYDTGCSFYEDLCLKQLPVLDIKYSDYIEHLGGGSWRENFLKLHYNKRIY